MGQRSKSYPISLYKHSKQRLPYITKLSYISLQAFKTKTSLYHKVILYLFTSIQNKDFLISQSYPISLYKHSKQRLPYITKLSYISLQALKTKTSLYHKLILYLFTSIKNKDFLISQSYPISLYKHSKQRLPYITKLSYISLQAFKTKTSLYHKVILYLFTSIQNKDFLISQSYPISLYKHSKQRLPYITKSSYISLQAFKTKTSLYHKVILYLLTSIQNKDFHISQSYPISLYKHSKQRLP